MNNNMFSRAEVVLVATCIYNSDSNTTEFYQFKDK